MKGMEGLIRYVDLLVTSRDESNGSVLSQTGDAVSGEVYCSDAELWGPLGYVARPSNPVAGAACQSISLAQSDRDVCVAYKDVRTQAKGGSIGPGEVGVYAGGPLGAGQARLLIKDDGTTSSISLMTTLENAEGGEAIIFTVVSDGTVMLQNGSKGGISFEPSGKSTWMNESCGIVLGDDGTISFSGTCAQIGTQQVMLGVGASPATPCTVGMVGQSAVGSASVLVAP